MGKKKSSKYEEFTYDGTYRIMFEMQSFDKNYALARINTANPAWKKMAIERNRTDIDIIFNGVRYPYRRCKTYKECEKEYLYVLEIINALLDETYDEEQRDYAEFVFGEKCKKDKDYVKCVRKFLSVA